MMENIYTDIIDSIEDGIVVFDKSSKITLFNQTSERITGISKRRAIGADGKKLLDNNSHILELARKSFETGQVFSDYDAYLLRRDGSVIPVSLVTSPIVNTRGKPAGAVLLIRDIRRVKELEEDVRRSDSLASIGVLAAGLAHEIKNPLGGIRGAAQLLQMELEEKEGLAEYTSLIVRETDRITGLIEELLDFANPKSLNLKEINIHEILDSVIGLHSRSDYGRDVEFIMEYDPSIPPVIGDRDKLAQVLINIVKNGCEAMDKRGRLRISTRVVSDYRLNEGESTRSKMMAVEITDSGSGIPDSEQNMLFTPFFTKKKGGTGLGLAISHRIIKEHRGSIKVRSREGEGTTFSLFLPLR